MRLWRYQHELETLEGRYHLRRLLGSGGMADVCLAWDAREQREVAIKVIKPDELDQRALNRFMKEASKIAHWQHPHILQVYSDLKLELIDPAHGSMVPYIVMEYAAGGDLHKRLRPGQPFSLNGILTLGSQLCSAVAYAHKHGVIHRDLKPLNILFRVLPDASEQVVLSDFGLAVEISATHHTYASGGTLPYMAPEQFRGAAIPESDIFALGVILYQLCTGRLPFRRTLYEIGRDIANNKELQSPPPPSSLQPLLPPDLDMVILRALAHDPQQRYQNAEDFWTSARAALLEPSPNVSSTFTSPRMTRITPLPPGDFQSIDLASEDFLSNPTNLDDLDNNDDAFNALSGDDELVPDSPAAFSSQPMQRSLTLSDKQFGSGQSSHPSAQPDSMQQSLTLRKRPRSQIDSMQRSLTPRQRQRSQDDSLLESLVPKHQRRSQSGSSQVSLARSRQHSGDASVQRSLTPSRRQSARTTRESSPLSRHKRSSTGSPPTRHPYRTIVLATILLLVLIGSALFALPGLRPLTAPIITILGRNHATITITASSQIERDTYTVIGVPRDPDTTKFQLTTHPITATLQSPPQTIQATGKTQSPGKAATGSLLFSNGSFASFTLGKGTQIKASNGIIVLTDEEITIPPADPNKQVAGQSTVKAHAAELNTKGNIATLTINQNCCGKDFVFVKNTEPFTGGQDPQDYRFVTQQDAQEGMKATLEQTTTQARDRLRQQLRTGEAMAGEPQCTSKLAANPAIGDNGTNITSSQVSVSVTCQAQAYSQQELQKLLAPKLQQKASTDLGNGYTQHGGMAIRFSQAKVSGEQISWVVEASGTWTYAWSKTSRQQVAHYLAGRSVAEARSWLQGQPGVASLTIDYPGDLLPTNPDQITIAIKS
ncbi:serine/threonine-protein kinase [Ktedonospora formicarum]|uniref:non-specific serine/threonine protein kinase n=1 Tax=Ktedonospora formicarum TaxID=2778364 RepID=A0A8J3MS26_9CHLR|nr:serine/threonine-protein kinase [Ktedonospora formicarum]GHO42905.1 hypothetical protein KSX_10680 [Ktedonospora formicarum]